MIKIVACLFFLLITPSVYFTLQAQAFECNATLSIPVTLAQRQILPDTSVKTKKQGVVCGVRDMRYMYLKTANPDIGITSFILSAVIDSADVSEAISVPNDGNLLDIRTTLLIQKAKKGSTVVFECIKARSSAGKTYMLKPLVVNL